ncbi:MAG: 2-C-methyl-D-erythritol 2,4-cyclodiphosphate synthase [Lentisphaeria bacterium]|nr:2-C-methyl-D-erythritol 2,4-cyclodiphosphate synthase [Lentisphaeria bacterium]
MTGFRVGQGFDVHRLVEDRKLILCGVEIPYELGLLGHSDADVAIHALIDALLGALALGDIGELFPDNDSQWKGADSTRLLEMVLALPEFADWHISNADITIIAQKPKLAPYKKQMQQKLAEVMKTAPDQVSVKATTTEKLGFTGRGEGIAASAVVALIK